MKHTLRQIFHSGKFVFGFCIFVTILLIVIIYPLFVKDSPLAIIGQGTFFPPGIYVNTFDTISSPTTYTLNLDDATTNRIASKLGDKERLDLKKWLVTSGIPEDEIDIEDTEKLLELWENNYDSTISVPGMTFADQRYYQRLDASLEGILKTEGVSIAVINAETGAL